MTQDLTDKQINWEALIGCQSWIMDDGFLEIVEDSQVVRLSQNSSRPIFMIVADNDNGNASYVLMTHDGMMVSRMHKSRIRVLQPLRDEVCQKK